MVANLSRMKKRLSQLFGGYSGRESKSRFNSTTSDAESRYNHRWARLARVRASFRKVILPAGILMCIAAAVFTNLYSLEAVYLVHDANSRRAVSRSQLEGLKNAANIDAGGPRRLRLFMPADGPHINLCKTVMSAVALGYPMPTILNWNGEFNRPDWHFAGSHIAKLESLLAVIDTLYAEDDDVNENDLVLLVDAYDIWFQLPPSVLIERFHRINRDADARVAKQWGEHGYTPDFPVPPPKQQIVVTTAKDCQPDWESGSNPRYEYWPDSPLPPDFYGEGTDKVLPYAFDSARKYKKIRPRCVNSGMIMGTIGALRGALQKCKEKVDMVAMSDRQLWSDQALFAEVIGDQEMWRYWIRGLLSTWNGTTSNQEELPREVRRVADQALAGEGFDFGIGLDYDFATIPPTCSSEDDGFFVRLDDTDAVIKESKKAGVPGGVRVKGIPPELEHERDPLPGLSWGKVPLYTDFFFGTIPVGIHHNAYIFGLKPWRLEHWWNMTWYYPHLRELVTSALQANRKLMPLARLPLNGDNGSEMVYWTSKEDEKMVKVFDRSNEESKFAPISWDGVCQKGNKRWYDALFGDEKGPLEI
ncbi:uncharacterized protein CTRU02_206109 [Colletotrichum truncatum]|uniref:Uncharacterized protein n=1 Tax=Colletotrichum truncatum TaxID=5467 RepID=A0ACC3Z5X9_COLTU|nr:uncharacterized protein CTRU02_10477 [Colletotrichum truncatum]KAF6787214.1 hypothetical protein CTRU02_10477 [Colletotrichum truncatum]